MLKYRGINEWDHKCLKQEDFPDEIVLQLQRTWIQAGFITLNFGVLLSYQISKLSCRSSLATVLFNTNTSIFQATSRGLLQKKVLKSFLNRQMTTSTSI
jgi:hypothetical protein